MSASRRPAQPNADAAGQLRSFAERIVRLKEEIKGLQQDIKDIKTEAASQGFVKKPLDIVVARMMEDATKKAARQEMEALADIYLASLGMLDGTPLGDAARRRLDTPPAPDQDGDQAGGGDDEASPAGRAAADDEAPAAAQPPAGAMGQEQVDAARAEGEDAAAAGLKVFANPYTAGDPRRAAWDEGWCRRTGSDGMDLPAAFRRTPKPAKADPDNRPDGGR